VVDGNESAISSSQGLNIYDVRFGNRFHGV